MDYTKIYSADITELLDDEDQVLAIVPYRIAHGAERVERDQDPGQDAGQASGQDRDQDGNQDVAEPRSGPQPPGERRHVQQPGPGSRERHPESPSPLDRLLDIDWPWNKIDWDDKLGGTSVAGRPGSLAVRLADGTRHGVSQFGVVTARRFVVVRRIATDRFTLVVEAPRGDVVRVRRRSRPFQRGRVVIDFTDGSQLAVHTGILLTAQANRLVAALSPEPPAER